MPRPMGIIAVANDTNDCESMKTLLLNLNVNFALLMHDEFFN